VLIMYAWTFLFAFTVVGLSFFGVALVVFPVIVVVAIGMLVLMSLPRWRSRRNGGGGAHAAGTPAHPMPGPHAATEGPGVGEASSHRASATAG
jgi:UDP-GlcNAc:undecaprenyl-phosphate GlcNAc-1-phosphate transferase